MLEKPDLQDDKIIACLQSEHGLAVAQLEFLPLGADNHSAVYRANTEDGTPYFVKFRLDNFDAVSVTLPKSLSEQGVTQLIPPLATKTGQLWVELDSFNLILYPFVAGRNGYEVDLSEQNWRDFGATLKRIHSAVIPPAIIRQIQRETYSPQWRELVRGFLERLEVDVFDDPVAADLATFLQSRLGEILRLVERTEKLAQTLQGQSPEFIVCHSDLHAGNVLIDANGAFYIVDWDNPILAPKERDLMYVGGGLMGEGRTPEEEERLFYETYGQTQVDPVALAYYRYERIVQDIAEFCKEIWLNSGSGEDRAQSLRYLKGIFGANGVLEIAYQSDTALGE